MKLIVRMLIAFVGCFMLFVGVFSPLIEFGNRSHMIYFDFGRNASIIILVLAVGSFLAILVRKYAYLWYTGLGSLGIMAVTAVTYNKKLSELRIELLRIIKETIYLVMKRGIGWYRL